MEGALQPHVTAFDASAALVSLLVYLGAASAVLARMPRDIRARTFFAVALTSAIAYTLPPLEWWHGRVLYSPAVIGFMAATFAVGSAALFHFTQVFPKRRPWIRLHGRWVAAAYAVPPLPVAVVAGVVGRLVQNPQDPSAGLGALSDRLALLLVAVILACLPALLFVGLVLPLAGLLSLARSWRTAKEEENDGARQATFWILVSQLGGGVLTVLVLPMLGLAGVGERWSTLIGALAYAFALIMPIAYWRGALSGDVPASTPQRHNSATLK